jgi:SAM-dependent methyltransferase
VPLPAPIKQRLEGVWDENEVDYRRKLLEAIPRRPEARLLDVGCDDGSWTAQVADRLGIPSSDQVSGIEIVDERRALAAARGYDVRTGDLEEAWPFDDASFDVVHANQVIEHVKRLDHFMEQAVRLLRPGGLLVICTENLASWHNVGALVLGYMPFSLTNISQRGVIGNPLGLHVGEGKEHGESWQHIHVVTLDALRSLFELFGLKEEAAFGAGYYPAIGKLGSRLAMADPRHAHFIGLTGRLPG